MFGDTLLESHNLPMDVRQDAMIQGLLYMVYTGVTRHTAEAVWVGHPTYAVSCSNLALDNTTRVKRKSSDGTVRTKKKARPTVRHAAFKEQRIDQSASLVVS